MGPSPVSVALRYAVALGTATLSESLVQIAVPVDLTDAHDVWTRAVSALTPALRMPRDSSGTARM